MDGEEVTKRWMGGGNNKMDGEEVTIRWLGRR